MPLLVALATLTSALEPISLPTQTRLPDRPARLESPIRALKIPPIIAGYVAPDEILATFHVDSAGAVRYQEARIVGKQSHQIMLQAVRNYLRDLRFVPALLNGREMSDSVQMQFTIRPQALNELPLERIHCSHCNDTLESQRKRVLQQAELATDCARAFREIARTQPTDTLVWASTFIHACANAEYAAALAVRLMDYGRHPDSTHALRTKIATAFLSRPVFDAAMAVAAQGEPAAQLYALEVLDRLQPAPRALGTLQHASFRDRCGPYIVDGVRTPNESFADYIAPVRQLTENLIKDTKTTPVVRKAAQCLLTELSR